MTVTIGDVSTFPHPRADKQQATKILEESAEVYAAWQALQTWTKDGGSELATPFVDNVKAECADLITAVSNLLDALGVEDMHKEMKACERRNRARGRYEG